MLIFPLLTENELTLLWGDIYRATRYIASSRIMFASDARTEGLKLMAQHRVEEGLFLSAWYVRWQKGYGSGKRLPIALSAIEAYGTHAKPLIPYLEEHVAYFEGEDGGRKSSGQMRLATKIRECIETIRKSESSGELMSISKYLNEKDIPPRDGP